MPLNQGQTNTYKDKPGFSGYCFPLTATVVRNKDNVNGIIMVSYSKTHSVL